MQQLEVVKNGMDLERYMSEVNRSSGVVVGILRGKQSIWITRQVDGRPLDPGIIVRLDNHHDTTQRPFIYPTRCVVSQIRAE